jgi:hypothetical protein
MAPIISNDQAVQNQVFVEWLMQGRNLFSTMALNIFYFLLYHEHHSLTKFVFFSEELFRLAAMAGRMCYTKNYAAKQLCYRAIFACHRKNDVIF